MMLNNHALRLAQGPSQGQSKARIEPKHSVVPDENPTTQPPHRSTNMAMMMTKIDYKS